MLHRYTETVQQILTIVAGILLFTGYIPYVSGMLRGTSHPTKASWIIWASLDGITVAGMDTLFYFLLVCPPGNPRMDTCGRSATDQLHDHGDDHDVPVVRTESILPIESLSC